MNKLQEFWRAIKHWNAQCALNPKYVPLPLGNRSTLKLVENGADSLRYFLLRLLSNKRLGPELMPATLRCECGRTYGLEALLKALQLECHNQIELDLVYSSFINRQPFIKSGSDFGGLKARLGAFLDFVHVCQAKATGTWTMEKERARQMDRARIRYADETLLTLLRILAETAARFQWPDEVMGWDEVENLYPLGKFPGQWVDD